MHSKEKYFLKSVVVDVEQIMADINNRALHIAESMEAAGNGANLTLVKDVLDVDNMCLIRDMIHDRAVTCVNLLRPFSKTPLTARPVIAYDNLNVEKYVIEIRLENMRGENDMILLEKSVRNYILFGSLADWLELCVMPDGVCRVWRDKAFAAREDIVAALTLPYDPRLTKVKPRWI